MSCRRTLRPLQALLIAATVAALFVAASSASAAPWAGDRNKFASPHFEEVWRNADLAVQQGRTGRSWTWGPGPWFDYKEVYQQSPNGLRQVQYFDKTRMEINDPQNMVGPLGGVTNGLLVVELVSGRIKLGNGIDLTENRQWVSADIPVAGDPTPASNPSPTYTSFRKVATVDNGYRDANKIGQRVGTTFTREGTTGFRQDLANQPGTAIVAYEPDTGHNVPQVFLDFMNAGSVPAIVAFGFPITDAYWITAQVGGQPKDVLVQLFERRAVTYTPSNPAAFRVEMGNVGQHYFIWRYSQLGQPWATPDPQGPIVFATKRHGPDWATYSMDPAGGSEQRITPPSLGALPYALSRTWLPSSNVFFYGESTSFNGKRQLIGVQAQTPRPYRPLISDANDYDPALSPDGYQIAFISDRDGNPELYLLTQPIYGGNGSEDPQVEPNIRQLTFTDGCSIARPSWLPDGSGLIYESNCESGNWEIWRGALHYSVIENAKVTVMHAISPACARCSQLLSNHRADDRWPRVSPDGSKIAFFSNRDGNTEVYTMNIDGGTQTRLTNAPAADEGPVWSPDGSKIAFNSNRDGDHEIVVMNADGSGQTQLTNNTVDDGFAVWGP